MTSTRIEIILGCMFSGKSTELLRRIGRYESIGKNVLLVNHTNDIRTDNSVETHNNLKHTAIKLTRLTEIWSLPDFKKYDVIGIDEAQFFSDLYDFVHNIEHFNKTIIVAGLDGDYKRQPMGQILKLIPLCDEVIKLTAMDMKDKDGTPAIFTKRIVGNREQILIGGADSYIAVSRKNYFDYEPKLYTNDNYTTIEKLFNGVNYII